MATDAERRMTVDQFYALPECNIHYELVRGYLVAEPLPGAQHGQVAGHLATLLNIYVRDGGRRGVVFTCDTAFELARSPDTVRGPDVAFLSIERYRALADVRKAVPGAPDLAVEIRSPSQSVKAMSEKARDYLAAGAAEVWVVNPGALSLDIYRPGHPVAHLADDDILTTPDVLPGFSVSVRDLIGRPV